MFVYVAQGCGLLVFQIFLIVVVKHLFLEKFSYASLFPNYPCVASEVLCRQLFMLHNTCLKLSFNYNGLHSSPTSLSTFHWGREYSRLGRRLYDPVDLFHLEYLCLCTYGLFLWSQFLNDLKLISMVLCVQISCKKFLGEKS